MPNSDRKRCSFSGSPANFPLEIAGKKREVPTYALCQIGGAVLGGIVMAWQAGRAAEPASADAFEFKADRFADIQVLRYRVPGFEQLPLQQKQLAYYLTEAGLSGRDIFWDRNIVTTSSSANARDDPAQLSRPTLRERLGRVSGYAKQVFFANGIHHHYGSAKMLPRFPESYLATLLAMPTPPSFRSRENPWRISRKELTPISSTEARRENGQPRRRRR